LTMLPMAMVPLSSSADEVPYGAQFNLLDPYVLASPNQYDAGSCLFMATTGAMEILLNQHTPLEEIEYEGDTDLSERFLMNAVDRTTRAWVPRSTTDALFAYNFFGGALLNRDYRFTAGYVCDTSTGVVACDSSDEDAYFSCAINWIDDLPENFEEMLVPTPEVDRTLIFLDPNLNENSIWNVALMDDDTVERIRWEVRTKRAPVLIIYNHYLYWHSDLVVASTIPAWSATAGWCRTRWSISRSREPPVTSIGSRSTWMSWAVA